ncbi:AAA family ATPase [Aurantivibrio plasticivorans]
MNTMSTHSAPIQRPAAEQLYKDELEHLHEWDKHPRPAGWQLSPIAVEKFVAGNTEKGAPNIQRKFVAPRDLLTRVIVGLLTNRGAMLVGEPGTAKSWLSELLSAAISGSSTLLIHGGAISSINQLMYSWNDALLEKHGPCQDALVPGPLYHAMAQGRILRFEELARAPIALQDALLSVLSERQFSIPELNEDSILFAKAGFNVVATSNTVDQGLQTMSAALKRRLNFETIYPIRNLDDEVDVVQREAHKLLLALGIDTELPEELIICLVTMFCELRNGETIDGRSTDRITGTSMSTAEAVSVAHALGAHAHFYRDGAVDVKDLVGFLVGATLKDNPNDRRRLRHYFDLEVAHKPDPIWRKVYRYKHLI